MIETPHITETTARLTALIPLTIPRSAMRTEMGPALRELMKAVSSQGIGPDGPWFTHHLSITPTTFDFEVCVPVTAPVTPTGRVRGGIVEAVRAARTEYRGDYSGLPGAWGEFGEWIAANGHHPASDLYECYRIGPDSEANADLWCTELTRPLKLGPA